VAKGAVEQVPVGAIQASRWNSRAQGLVWRGPLGPRSKAFLRMRQRNSSICSAGSPGRLSLRFYAYFLIMPLLEEKGRSEDSFGRSNPTWSRSSSLPRTAQSWRPRSKGSRRTGRGPSPAAGREGHPPPADPDQTTLGQQNGWNFFSPPGGSRQKGILCGSADRYSG